MIVLNVYCVRGRVDSLIACGKPRSRVADFIAKHYCGQLLIFDFFHVCMGGLDYPALRLSVYLIYTCTLAGWIVACVVHHCTNGALFAVVVSGCIHYR